MRIAPTRKVPIVQPLWVIETPVDRVCACVANPSDNPYGSEGFISCQHKSRQYIWSLGSALAFSSGVASGATRWMPPWDSES
jgi:hypothetical protein